MHLNARVNGVFRSISAPIIDDHGALNFWNPLRHLTNALSTQGKLNIAHHKSYHPYRADNIERVRRDEEEAKRKEEHEEGRMMLAVRHSSPSYLLTAYSICRTLRLVSSYYGNALASSTYPRSKLPD